MPRRALRPSFVVTFALGAGAIAGGCSQGSTIFNNPPGHPTSNGDAGCPAEPPDADAPCDLLSSIGVCNYGSCTEPNGPQMAFCEDGTWVLSVGGCNPPGPIYEAGPDVHDGGPDGEGQDAGHVADAAGDVAPDTESE